MALDTTNHDVYVVTAEIEEAPPAKRRASAPQHEAGNVYLLVVGKK